MKPAAVTAIHPTGKNTPKGLAIWQGTHRAPGQKDQTCTGSETEVRAWAKAQK